MHALEKQHLQRVSTQFSFEKNYTNSISRNIRKDNVVFYEANRYTVPTGTYRPKQSNVAYLEITADKRMLIRLSHGGEVIANHILIEGKGKLVQDPSHKRKRSSKLIEWEVEMRRSMEDKTKFDVFTTILKERYPRHLGDQFSILWNLIQNESEWINIALEKALDLQLKSANDLRDLLLSMKQSEPILDQQRELHDSAYSHINATTRNVESYIKILKGQSA